MTCISAVGITGDRTRSGASDGEFGYYFVPLDVFLNIVNSYFHLISFDFISCVFE
jgi:hypothetical protein